MNVSRASGCSSLIFILLFSLRASAQTAPPSGPVNPGVRAAGMGGAFTAVADDSSGVYWNPAGLATGSFFGLVVDYNSGDNASATMIALSTPPLGLSYYRTATADLSNGRNSLVAHHAGVTVVQSVLDRLAIGATVKGVRGSVESGSGPSVSSTKFDVDLGVMASGSLGRLGLTVHNLFEPEFAGPSTPVTLDRRVRAGISLNASQLTTVAADFDLTGEFREAAVGAEFHPVRKAWLRSGVHWRTRGGDADPEGSVGGTVAVYGSTVVDGQVSFGRGDPGWGLGLRFVF